MRHPSVHNAILLVAILAVTFGVTSCSSTKPAPQAETGQAVATPTPTPVPEVVVPEPENEPVPSVEVQEELPEDIKELNRRGYLKDVFFDTDSYELKPEGKTKLSENAAWLQKYPTVKILVEGHCDERNTREYNLALGERRANAVRDYLVFLGVSANRIGTISYGEERPFALGHDEAAWRLNRRAHFVITAR